MFLEALQSYYAPTIVLLFFAFILAANQLLSLREKKLFLFEITIVGLMIMTTWVDRCVSAITVGEWWRLRFLTSALQFAAAPISPLILLTIYQRNQPPRHKYLFALPAVVTAVLSLSSFSTGLVLQVVPGNIYSRGPLFMLPFVASALYLIFILITVLKTNTPGRKLETLFLVCAGFAIAIACDLEIVFVIRYMIWSTTAGMLLLYFLVLTILKVLYDTQTGVYSRLAYTKRLDSIKEGQQLTFAMIDLNDLKAINDCYGHSAGDQAIAQLSQALLTLLQRGRKLYRFGGDEFVLIAKGWCKEELDEQLSQILADSGYVEDIPLSFAYGIVEHSCTDIHQATAEMDRLMYENKAAMKATRNSTH